MQKHRQFILIYRFENKTNRKDLIAATALIILPELDSKPQFRSSCDQKFYGWPEKNNKAPILDYVKLCASFQSHRGIQTGVTVWKRWIRVKIGGFLSRVTLKFGGWPWKITEHLFYTTSSFVFQFKSIGEFKLKLQSGKFQFGSTSATFCPGDLEIWRMTLK